MGITNTKRTLSRGIRITLIVLGGFALLFVTGIGYGSWMDGRFERNGIQTQATVTEVRIKHHQERHTILHGTHGTRRVVRQRPYTETIFKYCYTVNGTRYEGEARSRNAQFVNLRTGRKIPIEYLSDAPAKSRLRTHSAPHR